MTAATSPEQVTVPGPGAGRRLASFAREYAIVVIFLALMVALTLSTDRFLTETNLRNLLDQSATVGIVACGMTLVIIAGGFDLSVGAIFALSGIVAVGLANAGAPEIGLIAGPLAGVVLGVINGALVTGVGINSFIATLASSIVFRGFAVVVTSATIITTTAPGFTDFGSGKLFNIKYPVFIFLAWAVITGVVLARTRLGRYIYAVGGNAEAARLSGIRVAQVKVITFAISGFAAGLAGIIETSRTASAQAPAGTGLELSAIAAAVLGGTSILGGEGAIWRTVLGVLILALIGNGFNLLNVDTVYQRIIFGGIILLAVWVDGWSRRRAAR
jgi:ribose transport system permease protein